MFEQFLSDFPPDCENANAAREAPVPEYVGLPQLLRSLGGCSFAGGLYRIVRPEDLEVWELRVTRAFPQFQQRIVCFGYDWLGSVFALDANRHENGQPGVVMFEPGSGEALEIPSNLLTFHNQELREFGEAALAISFFQQWIGVGGQEPSMAQCIGYKKPLFLGGKDTVENLEISDIDVYWHIMGQLIRRAKGLPEGTHINIRKD